MRFDGRSNGELRDIELETGYQPNPEGSVLVRWGETRVLCSVSVDYKVPSFMSGQGTGWITAEYSMLPGSGNRRVRRERNGLKGRTMEIQRLIGRSLRQTVDLHRMGERTFVVDCDVLVADGGTRMASVVGGAVALRLAIKRQLVEGKMKEDPFRGYVGGLGVGMVKGEIMLDLCYEEDSMASVDMNIVAFENGEIVEFQATAEEGTVPMETLLEMGRVSTEAIREVIFPLQREASGE